MGNKKSFTELNQIFKFTIFYSKQHLITSTSSELLKYHFITNCCNNIVNTKT